MKAKGWIRRRRKGVEEVKGAQGETLQLVSKATRKQLISVRDVLLHRCG